MSLDWENQYRIEETPWDKGEAAPPLLEWIENNPGKLSGSILVPGCGTGHDVRALAERTDAFPIVGLDVSTSAVAAAEAFPKAGRETYVVDDLFNLPEEHLSTYDWVWEHTCFCAILQEMRDAYVDAVWNALKPGGQLLAVFFLNPYDEEHLAGGGPPHGTSLEELTERFENSGKFRIDESYVPEWAYEGRESLEQVMRLTRLD